MCLCAPAVTPGSYIITTYHSTLREYETVVWHSRLLGLGMPPTKLPDTDYAPYTPPVENGVQTILSPSLTALVNKAAFGNACEFLASVRTGFNVSACEAFNGGVMKRGLNAAIQQWFLNAQEAGERQIRGQFIVNHLFEGAAWSIPQDIFNYSTAVRHGGLSWANACKCVHKEPTLRSEWLFSQVAVFCCKVCSMRCHSLL